MATNGNGQFSYPAVGWSTGKMRKRGQKVAGDFPNVDISPEQSRDLNARLRAKELMKQPPTLPMGTEEFIRQRQIDRLKPQTPGTYRSSGNGKNERLAMDYQKRGEPQSALTEMEKAAGFGLAARGGAVPTVPGVHGAATKDLAGNVISKAQAAEPGKYETKLTPAEETQFKQWKQKYAPNDSGDDYDLRGAFRAGLKPDPETGHWPDTYKKPNHPTFSDQSIYAKDRPDLAGSWQGDTYVPPGGQ